MPPRKSAKARRPSYQAVYTRRGGLWHVRVRGIEGAETTGRTLKEARRKLERALLRRVPELDLEEVRDRIRLDRRSRNALRSYRAAERHLERAQVRARKKGRRVAAALHEHFGLSLRDTADLLDVSLGWVQQLLEEADE